MKSTTKNIFNGKNWTKMRKPIWEIKQKETEVKIKIAN